MDYIDLRKLYYQDEAKYKDEYTRRFNSDLAIKVDFMISDKPAFFTQTEEVICLVYHILRLDKEITILSSYLPDIALQQYSRKCLIDEIVLTNEIEDVHSSRKEIYEALNILKSRSEEKKGKARFLGMINKYNRLMSSDVVLLDTCEQIRQLYDELVLAEVLAENKSHMPDGIIFRKDQAEINSAAQRVLHVGAYPESKIIDLMEKALRFLHDESVELLYRICIFHYLFEYVHPFYDGNGRLGRFIFSYCISKTMSPLLAFRISESIIENRKGYYDAFRICNDFRSLGDLTPFLLMMLHVVEKSEVELKNALEEKLSVWNRHEKKINDSELAPTDQIRRLYSVLIQAALFSEQGISTHELVDFMGISYTTLKSRLQMIERSGLLVKTKEGKERFYEANLKALDEYFLFHES